MLDRSRVASLALALTVVGYPLAAVLAEITVGAESGRVVTVPYRALVLLVSLLLFVMTPFALGRFRHPVFWTMWWTFWCLYLFRLLMDTLISPVQLPQAVTEYLLYGIGTTFLPAVGLAIGARHLDHVRAPRFMLLLACIGIVAGLAHILNSRGVSDIDVLAASRLESAMLNPISLGHLGATAIILSGWRLLWGGRSTASTKLYLIAAMTLGLAALVTGGSRGPVLALIVACGMIALAQRLILMPTLAITGIAALIALFGFVSETPLLVVERLTTSAFEDSSRENLLALAWQAFLLDPLIGAGIDPIESYPHNLVVEAFLVNGVVSGVLFSGLLISSLWIAFATAAASRERAWLPALYAQYATSILFSGNIYGSNIFWCLMAAVVAWSFVPSPCPASTMRRLEGAAA